MIAEIMGNKAGWLTLYSGIAGKADVILIPEIPYNIEKISQYIKDKLKNGRKHIILAVARRDYFTGRDKAFKERT